MKALVNSDGKVLVKDNKVATDECDPGCCGGVCCIGGVCYDTYANATDCETDGGEFHAGLTCDPDPCNITLSCDSVSSSASKCGFSAFQEWSVMLGFHGPYYTHLALPCNSGTPIALATLDSSAGSELIYKNATFVYTGCGAPDCTEGDTTGSVTINWTFDPNNGAICLVDEFHFTGATSPGFGPGYCSISGSLNSTFYGTWPDDYPGSNSCAPLASCASQDWSLSTPYTTGVLISDAEATLPGYDIDFDDDCEAIRNLSADETSYSVQRFKPRFSFSAADSARTVTYNEHFVPDIGSQTDTPRSIPVSAGVTEVTGAEIFEPSSNGIITVTNIAIS